jgi:hypothetical protein
MDQIEMKSENPEQYVIHKLTCLGIGLIKDSLSNFLTEVNGKTVLAQQK